ncbi:hypothetical protein OSB04_000137 [Centaurea solstitialis]|uniref:Reverse transcriptase zinc-binding domain-containing protein n=1 Tax=Centaurea solstitialis TaxID=347529 RepID=A0AA38WUD4_9ASTR|nr:hypothetical protein OSB04_000137 [Centaurea solstitialis]
MWKADSLSAGGKLTLCKSVLGSLGLYFFSLFRAPIKVIGELERIRRRFFWGSSLDRKKIDWVAWNSVIASLDHGGLGIGSLRSQNLSLLCKWWWRFRSEKGALWNLVIVAFHGNNGGLDESRQHGKQPGIWRNIVKIKKDFDNVNIPLVSLFQRKISPSSDIQFWQEAWLGSESLKKRFPLLYDLEVKKRCLISERMRFDENGLFTELISGWKKVVLSPSESVELRNLLFLCNSFSALGSSDTWSWALENSGCFSTASIRRSFDDLTLAPSSRSHFYWCNWVPAKVNVLVWRIQLNRIPTRFNLMKRGVTLISDSCPLCNSDVETAEHLFRDCAFSKVVFTGLLNWLKITCSPLSNLANLFDWGTSMGFTRVQATILSVVVYTYLWALWDWRNKMVFKNLSPRLPDGIVSHIQAVAFSWLKHRSGKGHSLFLHNWFCDPLNCLSE